MHYGHWNDAEQVAPPVKVYEVGEVEREEAPHGRAFLLLLGMAVFVIVAYAVVGYVLWKGAHMEALSCAAVWFTGRAIPFGPAPTTLAYEDEHVEELRAWMADCGVVEHLSTYEDAISYMRDIEPHHVLRWANNYLDGGIEAFDFSACDEAPVVEGAMSEVPLTGYVCPYADVLFREPLFSTPLPEPARVEEDHTFYMRTYAYEHAPSGESLRRDDVYGRLAEMGY